VVIYTGPTMTGKSYLANRYLQQTQGFEVGKSLSSGGTTTGIWMWNRPVPLSEDVDALVLDCEGLNAD
jgi:hypothetical protein